MVLGHDTCIMRTDDDSLKLDRQSAAFTNGSVFRFLPCRTTCCTDQDDTNTTVDERSALLRRRL